MSLHIFLTINIPRTHYTNEIIFKHAWFSSDLIESLKFVIQDRTGIPAEKISFIISGESIPDYLSLFDIGAGRVCSLTASINEEI